MIFTRKRILISIGAILLVGGALWAFFPKSSAQTFITEVVKRGDLRQTVEVTGELKSATDLSLAFETSGTVTTIPFEIGDDVKKGDVLAELGTAELGAAVEQARQAVLSAQAQVDLQVAGISSEEETAQRAQVAVVQAQYDGAVIDLDSALTSQSTGDAADSATLASAQTDYDQVAAQNSEATSQASEDLYTQLSASLATIRAGLDSADQILAVENTLFTIDTKRYLGVLDPTTLSDARDAYEDAAEARDSAEEAVLALSEASESSEVLVAYSKVSTALSLVSNTLLYTSRVLGATVSDTVDLSNADLIVLQTMIATERSAVSTGLSALRSTKQTYDSAVRQASDREIDATNALALARAQQAAGEATRQASVLKAQASLAISTANLTKAQADLDKVLADPRDIDLAGLQANVGRAQADYDAAIARLHKAQIIAPVDGVVSDIIFDIGEQITAGQAMIAEIAADDAFEIVLDVPEADISKLAVGQLADITFDAFGDNQMYKGSVYSVNPAQKVISDVVFYEAKIVLDIDQDLSLLKPGMSANVTIATNQRTDVLYVPTRAVLERGGVPYVRVPKNDSEFNEVTVTTGLKADDGLTEILSGVNEGQTIVTTIKTK